VKPSAGLRERHKDQRRGAIVAAAAALVAEGGVEALRIRELAARADVSPATIYNLIGGMHQVAAAVVDRVLDVIDDQAARTQPADPLIGLVALIDQSFAVFLEREAEVRPAFLLLEHMRMSKEWVEEKPFAGLVQRTVAMIQAALDAAQAVEHFDRALSTPVVAATLYASYKEQLMFWVSRHATHDLCRARARRHAAIVLLSGALGAKRAELLQIAAS